MYAKHSANPSMALRVVKTVPYKRPNPLSVKKSMLAVLTNDEGVFFSADIVQQDNLSWTAYAVNMYSYRSDAELDVKNRNR